MNDMAVRLRADPAYKVGFMVYDQCMQAKGYRGQNGATLRADIQKRVDADGVSNELQRRERSAAVADFRCQARQDEALRKIRSKYEREFLESNGQLVSHAMDGRLGR